VQKICSVLFGNDVRPISIFCERNNVLLITTTPLRRVIFNEVCVLMDESGYVSVKKSLKLKVSGHNAILFL
jgi:hypothetical protein